MTVDAKPFRGLSKKLGGRSKRLDGQHVLSQRADARERFRQHARGQVFPRFCPTADIGALYRASRLARAIYCMSVPDRSVEHYHGTGRSARENLPRIVGL